MSVERMLCFGYKLVLNPFDNEQEFERFVIAQAFPNRRFQINPRMARSTRHLLFKSDKVDGRRPYWWIVGFAEARDPKWTADMWKHYYEQSTPFNPRRNVLLHCEIWPIFEEMTLEWSDPSLWHDPSSWRRLLEESESHLATASVFEEIGSVDTGPYYGPVQCRLLRRSEPSTLLGVEGTPGGTSDEPSEWVEQWTSRVQDDVPQWPSQSDDSSKQSGR